MHGREAHDMRLLAMKFLGRLGCEVRMASDGYWQVTSKTGARHVNVVGVQFVRKEGEPQLLALFAGPVSVTFGIVPKE